MFKTKLVANVIILALLLSLTFQVTIFGISFSQKNLSGTVYAATGVPVSGASVIAFGDNGYGFASTDSSGNFLISQGLPSGTYNVTASHPGYIDTNVGNIIVTAGNTTTGVSLYMNLSAVIAGKVSDSSNSNGIANIFVSAIPSSGTGTYFGSGHTDANGNYEMTTNLGTGSYNVSVSYPTGYVGKTIGPISATAGTKTTGHDLSLDRSGIVSGHITTPLGVPIANATVIASSISGANTYFGSNTTDNAGAYRIDSGLGTANYTITVFSGLSGFNSTINPVIVTAGSETSNIDLELTVTPPTASGTITGKVTDTNSNPIKNAHVQANGINTFSFGDTHTDANGNYIISQGLATDNYTVTASASGFIDQNVSSVSVTVHQIKSNVNFQLQQIPPAQSGSISGTVNGDANAIPEFPYPVALVLFVTLVSIAIARSYRTKKIKIP
jgi:hypothetical protein